MADCPDLLYATDKGGDRNGGASEWEHIHDAVGNLETVTYPNTVKSTYTFNTLNRLTNLTATRTATTVASFTYTLGAAGNRLSVAEASGRTVNYTYDALYRLTNETIANDPLGTNGSVGYTYDAVGNRLSRTSTLAPIPAQTSTYDENDWLNSDTYDQNGNTTVSSGSNYKYDFENRLLDVNDGNVKYAYDGDGNRVAKTVAGVTTKYLVDTNNHTGYAQVVEEIQNGTVTRSYTYGHDLISQNQLIGDTWSVSFYGYDGHGSVRYLTDDAGTVTDTYDYDAFGTLISRTGSTPNEYLYTGERFDAETGMYYLRARYMQPATGRFWTFDTYEGSPYDPSSLHKYTYTGNDPVNHIDPSGNSAVTTSGGLMIALAVAGIIAAVTVLRLVTLVQDTLLSPSYIDHVSTVGHEVSTETSASVSVESEASTEQDKNPTNLVYRAIRDDENPALGLYPKAPAANESVERHVRNGSAKWYKSQYISTTRSIFVATKWALRRRARIVEIDLKKVAAPVIDLTTEASRFLHMPRNPIARNFARNSQEILVQGTIPPFAITKVIPLQLFLPF